MSAALVLAGLSVWAAGAGVDLLLGPARRPTRAIPYWAGLAGGVLVTIAGVRCAFGSARVVHLGTTLGLGETSIRLDALAGAFLVLTAGLGAAISACLIGWVGQPGRQQGRGTAAAYMLLLASMTVVIVAGDAFGFLVAWESLTVAFYILSAAHRSGSGARASWATISTGKLGGAALLLGFLLLASRTGSLTLASWSQVGPGALRQAAYVLLIIGFAAKVGLLPFQAWMPLGYSAAPGPLRAAMAGMAVNVGFYGLWRFLGILGGPPVWLTATVLLLGGATALLGIAFAAVQSGLNRVIAYSSIENAGVILVGYGVALAGAGVHDPPLVAAGLLAASLQVVAHAVGKSGLFASSAFFLGAGGGDGLEGLRGVGRRHRFAGTTFAIGSLTLAGLPPTIGFVSEWFVLEALLQQFRIHSMALRLAMAGAGALVALTAGVAALTFVRLVGLIVLGRPVQRQQDEPPRGYGGVTGWAGLALIASSCLGLAAFAPWLVRLLARGLSPVLPGAELARALKSPWVLQPVFGGFSILSPSWLFIVMPLGALAVVLVALALSRGSLLRARRVPAWRSATSGVAGPDRYSAFGYANALRHVLGNVLGTRREAVVVEEVGGAQAQPSAHVEVRTSVVEPVETYLYRPARAGFLRAASLARKLQCGRLDAYVGYMLFALLALLAVVAAIG